MEIQGKVNSAKIYTDNIDEASMSQIYNMLNIPCFADSCIAIMPDVHMGRGSVVGFTMTFNNFVNPSVIGVDIGCGVSAYKIGRMKIYPEKFDEFIKSNIPTGSKIHKEIIKKFVKEDKNLEKLIEKVAPKEHGRILRSIGTLGGGNHFIELDKDEEENIWLILHSGSRNLGLQVCKYHQRRAKEVIKEEFQGAGAYHGMEYLSMDNGGESYLNDMKITQGYAENNRKTMAKIILEEYFNLKLSDCKEISSIHNYLNFNDNIVRKGAISAHKGEDLIIPLNMRDGCIIAEGKGNKEWNYSAPHGAGRLLKRSETKELIGLEEFKESMEGIYSSCVNKNTIDESPMAYKDAKEIELLVKDTVKIKSRLKPVYNFKG